GRFLSPDPLAPEPGEPQSWNRYAYVVNNPLNYIDPTGHTVECGYAGDHCGFDRIPEMPASDWDFSSGQSSEERATELLAYYEAQRYWNPHTWTPSDEATRNGLIGEVFGYQMQGSVGSGEWWNLVLDNVGPDVFFGIAAIAAGSRPPTGTTPLKFGQASVGPRFTSPRKSDFKYAGWKLEDVAGGLRSGQISPDELPVRFIERDGMRYAINNRSLKTLRMAGVEPTILIDITGDPYYEKALTRRLAEANRLGIDLNDIPIRGR
ncbi:MAG: RHS repeat-associated core domain-containing protein, partial [Anaerolineae bacterium]